MSTALKYWIWLTSLPGLNYPSRHLLLSHFRTPEAIYFAEWPELSRVNGLERRQAAALSNRSLDEAERILERCHTLGYRLMTCQDADYPQRLQSIYNPPCLLYIKGRLPPLDETFVVSVVGTRTCTTYGLSCAERLSYGLATGGATVASGLARGIDSAAIRGALLGGGPTIGVLGNGLDVVYPRENAELYEYVAATGALVSEYPPGTEPLPGNFPVRNRILSGVSAAVLVVEAPKRSGALITASLALEQGRDVFAVPGPIDAYASVGCNDLIYDGAGLVAQPEDVLDPYRFQFSLKPRPAKKVVVVPPETPNEAQTVPAPDSDEAQGVPAPDEEASAAEESALPVISLADGAISPEQASILSLMNPQTPLQTDELIERSGLPARQVLSELTMLQIEGYVREYSGKRYTRLVEIRDEAATES